MHRPTITVFAVFMAAVLATSVTLLVSSRVSGAQTTSEQTVSEETVTEEVTSGETISEEAVPEETTSEESTGAEESTVEEESESSEGAVAEDPAPEETTSEEANSEEKTSEDKASEKETSDKAISGKAKSKKASRRSGPRGAPLGTSPYRVKPPDLYPEEESIPEPGEDFPAYNQVVDNTDKERFEAPGWRTESSKPARAGENYLLAGSSEEVEKAARYKVEIPATDVYSVYAWWPNKAGEDAKARFGISTESGVEWSEVDQSKDGGYWVPIGEYRMEEGNSYAIQVAPVEGSEGPAVADSVAVVRGVLGFPPNPPRAGAGEPGEKADREAASGKMSGKSVRASGSRIRPRLVMRRADWHLGTKYGNSSCKAYVQEDCECFTRLVYRKWLKLPESPVWQWTMRKGRKVSRSNLQRGDLVFHDTNQDGKLGHWDHVSIYIGNGKIIHASSYYGKVVKGDMKYLKGYWGAKRLR